MFSKKKILISVFLLTFFVTTVSMFGLDLKGKTIHITDDGNEWPPYTYYEIKNNKKSDKLVGYSIDVLKYIFDKNGIKYDITLLPWIRAQKEVESGVKYQMVLSASYSDERAQKYYITEPYYSTSAYCFYSKKYYPNGLNLKSKEDLKKYKITGMLGHNYSNFGVDNNSVYMGSGDYQSMINQLHSGYYDVFLESLEVLAGWATINSNILKDKNLGYEKIPDIASVNFYMMFTKNETGLELKKIVDDGIKELRKNNKLNKMLKTYVP